MYEIKIVYKAVCDTRGRENSYCTAVVTIVKVDKGHTPCMVTGWRLDQVLGNMFSVDHSFPILYGNNWEELENEVISLLEKIKKMIDERRKLENLCPKTRIVRY